MISREIKNTEKKEKTIANNASLVRRETAQHTLERSARKITPN
jgi:hypothetical protein